MYQYSNPTLGVYCEQFNARRENTNLWEQNPLMVNFDREVHTIPQALYNTQANFWGRPANLYKEDGEWRTITFTDLVFRVENIAIALIKLGIEAGDMTGIKARTSVRWTWADMASLFVGAATASIHATNSQKETIMIANHSGVKLIFVDTPENLDQMNAYRKEMPTVKYLVCLQKHFKGNGQDIFGMDELLQMGEQAREVMLPKVKERVSSIKGDSPAAMVYTSGTTGDLKGVMHSHKNLCYGCTRSPKHYFNCGHIYCNFSVNICLLPLSHIVEKCHSYYMPIAFGACIGFAESMATLLMDYQVIQPTFQMFVPRLITRILMGVEKAFSATTEGKQLWDWAMDVAIRATYALENEDGNINTNIPIPEQLEGQLKADWIKAYNMVFYRVRYIFGGHLYDMNVGGAALDPIIHRKLVGMGFFVGYGYGLTETSAGINQAPPNATKIGWASQVNPGVEIRLDDDGEILVKGHGIITEYYKNPQATADSFTADGFFRTGDIGEISEEGYVRIIDRKKSLIILDTGKNVPMSKIEALCESTTLIDQIVVTGQDQKYVGALLVPAFEAILGMLKAIGFVYDESRVKYGILNGLPVCLEVGQDVINHELVQKAIKEQIDQVNAQLEHYESIKQYKIMNRCFTEEAGEVTASQKLRMKIINDRYKEEIASLF